MQQHDWKSETKRMLRMFGAEPALAECKSCRHWHQRGGTGNSLFHCTQKDHMRRLCQECRQWVCRDCVVPARDTPEYATFLHESAKNSMGDECVDCRRYFAYADLVWCDGHGGTVCRECVFDLVKSTCPLCSSAFCANCEPDTTASDWCCDFCRDDDEDEDQRPEKRTKAE